VSIKNCEYSLLLGEEEEEEEEEENDDDPAAETAEGDALVLHDDSERHFSVVGIYDGEL